MLSYFTRWDFNWHVSDIYADDAAPLLPKGTVLHLLRGTTTRLPTKRTRTDAMFLLYLRLIYVRQLNRTTKRR